MQHTDSSSLLRLRQPDRRWHIWEHLELEHGLLHDAAHVLACCCRTSIVSLDALPLPYTNALQVVVPPTVERAMNWHLVLSHVMTDLCRRPFADFIGMDFGSARPSLEAAAGFFATLTASMGRLHPFLARVRSCNCSPGSWCTSPANDRSRFSYLSEVVSASGRLSAAAVGFVRELSESFLASARRCSPPSTSTAVPEAKVEPSSADSASAIERRAGRGGSAAVSAIALGDVDGLRACKGESDTGLNSMRSSKDRGLRL